MILSFVARGKKLIASGLLVVLYLEIVIPLRLSAAVPVIRTSPRTSLTVLNNNPAGYTKIVYPFVGKPAITDHTDHIVEEADHASGKAVNAADKTDHADIGGPTQPEMQAFHSAGNENMVDLFSGDFNYNIPLLDVGGYPVTIGYNSGISMDQEASWVGLGWNINPGSITRNMRGIPDDFNGKDSITKEMTVKENQTVGVTAGGDMEIAGLPLSFGGSVGIFRNTYRGWGLETAVNAGISAGNKAAGSLTAGLSVTNNSQEGLTLSPSLGVRSPSEEAEMFGGYTGSLSMSTSYNSRSGLSGLQLSGGIRSYSRSQIMDTYTSRFGSLSTYISFAYPGYSPTIHIPYTNKMTTVTLKVGGEITFLHPSLFISGYVTRQSIAEKDHRLSLPAFGYLNYQSADNNRSALLDFNREKEIPYREYPAIPNIAIPSYTYDVFSMTGEGIGGNFRAYRNDIGYVYDHEMTTRDASDRFSGDIGVGEIVHGGVDLNFTRSFTKSALWESDNSLRSIVGFRKSNKAFEASYFRSPGEKTINATSFYDAMGGDNVVTPRLFQSGNSSTITATNRLTPYVNAKPQNDITLNNTNVVKPAREKRTQSITYLTAKEASEVGLSKYIENYRLNEFSINKSKAVLVDEYGNDGDSLHATYFTEHFKKEVLQRDVPSLDFPDNNAFNIGYKPGEKLLFDLFTANYVGKLRVPVSGTYWFKFNTDDGFRFRMKGEEVLANWTDHMKKDDLLKINLEGGQLYDISVDYFNNTRNATLEMSWWSAAMGPNPDYMKIPPTMFYRNKDVDTFMVPGSAFIREKRINSFRKEDHISEIDVLNSDGRKYVYGIPVYNLRQKEVTFSVNRTDANANEGTVNYTPNVDDTLLNQKGNDWYYEGEFMPPYAHSFLLTGILSPDYVDITGDGISDDDPGNAIRFNYTKTAGIRNPYLWRAPYSKTATYNEGMKTDNRDDKGSYVSGKKELWFLNSIESKNMVALFILDTTERRQDLLQIDSLGNKTDGGAKRLKQIDLYTKADYLKNGKKARPVKTVHFEYTYELCPGVNNDGHNGNTLGKLTLKKIWFSYNGNDKGKRNAYIFNYNKLNPTYATYKYDRWGNYKDPLQNPGSSAGNLITNSDYPYALQDSTLAATNAAAWTLDSIIMPSGGRMKIDYESDDYAYVQDKRAMQMCKIAGFSKIIPTNQGSVSNKLYDALTNKDYLYVAIKVPYEVNSDEEVYARYLEGVSKIYFRMFVRMPGDKFGSGSEFVPCYASIDPNGGYGFLEDKKTIWVKLSGINNKGDAGGDVSPLVKTAIQFLKLNLPSKAYPGSDEGDNPGLQEAVQILWSQADNIVNTLHSFDVNARARGWAQTIDTSRSVARLNSPYFKKYGGGLRVKRITTYDYWNKMTGQRGAVYGKEYNYTTTKVVNGNTINISSGVAAYEPILGGEENPWHMPVEYTEQVSVLAPVTLGYTEEPLGESFFPAPSVGYSKVRVRTINAKKNRSANGYDETCFYTTKDFPTITERTTINGDTKKRFKSPLGNLLKINVRHFLAVSQGFKVELNDMNGKLRSQASYSETDPDHWIAYTENFYKVDNQQAAVKHLDNRVLTISPKGVIDTSLIGKDMELMLDMREERTLTNGINVSANSDFFTVGIWPWLIPTLIPMPQREETVFRSLAATKVINRHGILDSVVTIDKGSKVVTRNLLFDTESGDPVLTTMQNEYNDTIFNYNYPAAWIYEGMAGAYKNVGVVLDGIDIKEGRIVSGLNGNVNDYFFSGDELLAFAKRKVAGTDCEPEIAYWPASFKVWVVDANMLKGGTPDIYFINQDGSPLSGSDISLKIIRSGRRNINASAGSISMRKTPLVPRIVNGKLKYDFVLNSANGILNASVTEYKEFWKVPDRRTPAVIIDTFRNERISRNYMVICGGSSQSVAIAVEAGRYISVATQQEADNAAAAYLDFNGQYLANQQVHCAYFYSKADSAYFRKNNCTSPGIGDLVKYVLKAGADSSITSQAAADALAAARLNSQGQSYANSNGRCYYYNEPQSGPFTKNDCPPGRSGSTVTYTLPTGTDSSYISVADANSKTMVKVNSGGQAYANANGSCSFYAKLIETNQTTSVTGTVPSFSRLSTRVDLVINFYEDEACTIPYAVTDLPITVNILEYITQTGDTPPQNSTSSKNYTVSGASVVLESQAKSFIIVRETLDGKESLVTTTFRYTYSLAPNSAFIIK